jgi:cupin 2 domain-containing protein
MAIDLRALKSEGNYLYHLTYVSSLARIRRNMRLDSAAKMINDARRDDLLQERRTGLQRLVIEEDEIILTDQRPLHAANVSFEGGWSLGNLVEAINRRVFFWRGDKKGLLERDRNHFETYQNDGVHLAFLRMPFGDMVNANRNNHPEFCQYNSGGPRSSNGEKSPRGPNTFVRAPQADFSIGDIREVVFNESVNLPDSTQISFNAWNGPWRNFEDLEDSTIHKFESALGKLREIYRTNYNTNPSSFEALPSTLVERQLDIILNSIGTEPIVSLVQSSPEGFWYDQDENKWIILLKGAARLTVEDKTIDLAPGDFINLPAYTKHRVEWTNPDEQTVWLAGFY